MPKGFIVGVMLAAIGIGGLLAFIPPHPVSFSGASLAPTLFSLGQLVSPLGRGPSDVSVLVLGFAGEGYTSGSLADTILFVRYIPETNTAHLVSIPRDLWIADGDLQYKINEVLPRKRIEAALITAQKITGIIPDGYLAVDLATVGSIVDRLGGVDIVLDEVAVDWVSGFSMGPGPVHLNGEDAIWLIRNRYNREGDFFREKNQQKIIESATKKFRTLSTAQKLSLAKEFLFNPSSLSRLHLDLSRVTAFLGKDMGEIKVNSIVLNFETGLFKTDSIALHSNATTTYASVILPTEGFDSYDAVREYVLQKIDEQN